MGFEAFRSVVQERLDLLPFARERIVNSTSPLGYPSLVLDEEFDLDMHLFNEEIEESTYKAALREVFNRCSQILSVPLPRDRAPWEIHFFETSQEISFLLVKVHHALLDGGLGVEAFLKVLGDDVLASTPWSSDGAAEESRRGGSPASTLFGTLLEIPGQINERVRSALELQDSLSTLTSTLGGGSMSEISDLFNLSAPKTSINRALTPNRAVVGGSIELAKVRRLAKGTRSSINAVVLAATASSVGEYLLHLDGTSPESVTALMPISLRRPGELGGARNKVSAQLVTLTIVPDDPLATIERAAADAEAAKDRQSLLGPTAIEALATSFASPLAGALTRLASNARLFDVLPPVFNLVVSNVAGPRQEVMCAGSVVERIYPFGPLAEGAPINVTVLSYLDELFVGISVCPDLVPEARRLVDGFMNFLSSAQRALRERGDGKI